MRGLSGSIAAPRLDLHEDTVLITNIILERRWVSFPNAPESALPRTEHAMCNVGDKLYILGGQLDLNITNEDMGMIFVLDTGTCVY